MFAVAITLVVLISAAVLLYQYWAGSLMADDADAGETAAGLTPDTLPTRKHHRPIDNAA